MRTARVFVTVLALVCPAVVYCDVIHVPVDQPTIQAGIIAAMDYDTVLVAPGTYVENINFLGKAIMVISMQGPEVTIIDGNQAGTVVVFNTAEDQDSVLQGFTIRGGVATFGGGIYCEESSPTITNCTICGNDAGGSYTGRGAGIYCHLDTSPSITNCTITGNTGASRGGGIYFYDSNPTITNCIISGNIAAPDGYGGGIYCQEPSPTITNCTITGNSAWYGGGIYCYTSDPTITNCIIWNNSAEAIYVAFGDPPVVTYSDIQGGWEGEGNIDANPSFITGPFGDYYLFQATAGEPVYSPCVDAGDPSSPMIVGTTRTDSVQDSGIVDMGYHYPLELNTVSADLTCEPSSGTLPFVTNMTMSLTNNTTEYGRRFAGRIDILSAGGMSIPNWRSGWVNVGPGDSATAILSPTVPESPTWIGINTATLVAEDVTPAPYNQPPFPPSGDMDTDVCEVVGVAP